MEKELPFFITMDDNIKYNNKEEQLSDEIKFLQVRLTELENAQARHKLTEKELRKTELQQKAILDNIPDIAWLKDKESRFISVNEQFGKVCGVNPEDLVGKTDFDIWPKNLAERYVADDLEVMESGKRKRLEEPLADKEGQIKWIETIKTPIYNENGQIIGTTGISRDITERKQTEERLRQVHVELGIRVKVRTAELTKANEDLRNLISEHKQMVDMLRESEERYRSLVETSPDAITLCDKDGNIIMVNQQAASLHGFSSKEEMAGNNVFDFIAAQDRQRARDNASRAAEIGTLKNVEYVLLKKDGTTFLGEISASVLLDAQGNPKGFIGVVRDITERKQIEDALWQGERLLSTVFSSIQDGISILDNDMNIIRVNDAMEKWYAHAMPLVGKKCFEAYHSRGSPCEICPTRHTIQTKEAGYEVVSKRGPGGEITGWLDLYSFPLIDLETGQMNGIIEYVRDITERRKTEVELVKSEKRYRGLVESQQELIVRVDSEGRFIFVNNAYCSKFGKKREELLGTTFMPLVHQDDLPATLEAMKGLEEPPYRIYVEQRARTSEGWRWIAWEDYAIRDESGKTLEIQAVGRDIHDRKIAEEKLEFLNKELLKSNKRLKQLSLMDSHTGLYNHRYLEEVIEAEFHRAKRYAHTLAVIMLDIDYFKSINDVYGHQFGDLVLKQFARQLKRMVRRYDIVIRFGGEEFLIISPGIDRPQTLTVAQRLLDALNLYNFGNKKHTVKLKLSLAVCSYPEDKISRGMDLIDLVEHVLNKAKEYGGNRVYSSLDMVKRKQLLMKKNSRKMDIRLLKGKLDKLTKKANQSSTESIFAFAKTIELKDHYTGEHVENTVRYALEISKALGLPQEEMELVKQAAMLHDLGKIGVSENILLKKTKLTKKEFEEIKKHPQIGADIIRPLQFLHGIIPFIFYHHERWDGKGYPSGIRGEDIPIGARIIALADVYQALISDRPYRKAYSKREALRIIKNGSGTQFDPRIVSAFFEIMQSAS